MGRGIAQLERAVTIAGKDRAARTDKNRANGHFLPFTGSLGFRKSQRKKVFVRHRLLPQRKAHSTRDRAKPESTALARKKSTYDPRHADNKVEPEEKFVSPDRPEKTGTGERIAKVMARSGIASRRES